MKKRIVIKIGTSTLTAGTKKISRGKIEDLARQIESLKKEYEIILVSSGAIATARQFVSLAGLEEQVQSKQALSAIGQPKLMQIYSEVFADFNLKIAQCLMTYRDVEHPISRENTRNTIEELLRLQFIPIINENDTVAVEELIVGDNDKLSALVATLIGAHQLVIASDIDGLFTKNPNLYPDAQLVEEVTQLEDIAAFIEERHNGLGTGGMTSKIEAVRICAQYGIEVLLVNGFETAFIQKALERMIPCTRFNLSK